MIIKLKDFIFWKILYPIFQQQFDQLIDDYRMSQVYSIDIDSSGLIYVKLNKSYPLGSQIIIYKPSQELYSEDSREFLGILEEVYAYGKVVECSKYFSKILILKQEKEIVLGLFAKKG